MARETRTQAMRDITRALSRHGPAHDLRPLKSRKYADVPRATWWRWVAKVRDSGAPGRKAAKRIKKKVARRAKKLDPKKSVAKDAEDQLPEVIRPSDISGDTGLISVVDRIQSCIQHAEKVVKWCEREDGSVRNPKLYLVASRHILEAMKTASSISHQLMDAQRIDQFHQAILNRLKERDPVLVEQILDDLERLNHEWGAVT